MASEFMPTCKYMSADLRCMRRGAPFQQPSGALTDETGQLQCAIAIGTITKQLSQNPESPLRREDIIDLEELVAENQQSCNRREVEKVTFRDRLSKEHVANLALQLNRSVDYSHLGINSWTPNPEILRQLQPGDRITGFESINDLHPIDRWIGSTVFTYGRTTVSSYFTSLSNFIEARFRKMNYNGRTGNIDMLVVEPDVKGIKYRGEPISPADATSVITTVDLHSTGRGRVGSMVVRSTFYKADEAYMGEVIKSNHKELKGKGGMDALELLILSSRAGALTAKYEALRNVVSGGLPGLGKRR